MFLRGCRKGKPEHLQGVVAASPPSFLVVVAVLRERLCEVFSPLLLEVTLIKKKAKHSAPNRTTVCGSVLHVCVWTEWVKTARIHTQRRGETCKLFVPLLHRM